MIQFKHYSMSSDIIGTGDVVFKRYAATKSRFAQYVEGTLTELLPEDFGNITTVRDYTAYGCPLVSVEMPDTVTTVEQFNFCCTTIKKVIFSANISSINQFVCNGVSDGCIADFSKAKSVPTIKLLSGMSNTSFYNGDKKCVINVPSALYETWINTTTWKDLASNIVAV